MRGVLPALADPAAGSGCSSRAAGLGSGAGSSPPAPVVTGDVGRADTTAYDAAVSRSQEDSVYPDVGDPGVDALHYDLHLSWEPRTETLTATETLVLRATRTAGHLQLDLAHQLAVGHVWLDGREASGSRHPGPRTFVVDVRRSPAGDRHRAPS